MMAGPVDGWVRLIRHFLVPRRARALMEAEPIHRRQTALKKHHCELSVGLRTGKPISVRNRSAENSAY